MKVGQNGGKNNRRQRWNQQRSDAAVGGKENEMREQFERWISSAPYEMPVVRFPDEPENYAWPGNYKNIAVELAWQAWQEASKRASE
jgi:hypothetical protein